MFDKVGLLNSQHYQKPSEVMPSTNEDPTSLPPPQQQQHQMQRQELNATTIAATVVMDSRFSCNICLDSVVEPVVTQCGHLYCWPCLYRWLEPGMYPDERASLGLYTHNNNITMNNNSSRRVCPVCKSPCSVPTLVPIYVRSTKESSSPIDDSTSSNNHERISSIGGKQQISDLQNEDQSDATDTVQQETEVVESMEEEGSSQHPLPPPEQVVGLQENTNSQFSGNLGLRQRRPHTNTSILPTTTATTTNANQWQVPNRPAANSPQHPPTTNRPGNSHSNNGLAATSTTTTSHHVGNWMSPMSPNSRSSHHHGSLTQGILMSFQQAAIQARSDNGSNDGRLIDDDQQQNRSIPSLHSIRDGNVEGYHPPSQQQQPIDVNSETTQYLSRLLIMLTSFVVLCLLLL
jgi:hypothetical protein